MRQARSSRCAGNRSTVSPRTRKVPRRKVGVGALVLQRDQIGDQLPLVDLLAERNSEGHRRVGLDRADAVDARDRRDDDDVVTLEQRARRRVAHAVDLLVDRGFLLDVGVRPWDVRLWLVVVVVGDEILDRVVREERLELAVELGRQRLVGRQDQRRALRRLDHLGRGVGLARAGDAEQHLVALLRVHPRRQARRSRWAGRPWARTRKRCAAAPRPRTSRAAAGGAVPRSCRGTPAAGFDQRRQRLDGGGDRVLRQAADILEIDVEAGDRAQADGGAFLGRAAAAHRRAAACSKGLFLPGRAFGAPSPLSEVFAALSPKPDFLGGAHAGNMGDRGANDEGRRTGSCQQSRPCQRPGRRLSPRIHIGRQAMIIVSGELRLKPESVEKLRPAMRNVITANRPGRRLPPLCLRRRRAGARRHPHRRALARLGRAGPRTTARRMSSRGGLR